MLASIEARLRRLNKMAQRSAIGLSSLLPTMQQRGAVEGGGNGGGGGEGTPGSRSEQELPEWKFFNKVQCMGGRRWVSYRIFSWGGGRRWVFLQDFFLGWRENVDACKGCIRMSKILNEILDLFKDKRCQSIIMLSVVAVEAIMTS